MSLSKRDTLVRYLDPMKVWWEDANGDIHASIPNALQAFDLEDNPTNREKVFEILKKASAKFGADEMLFRPKPDSPEYFETCDRCERCGKPIHTDFKICVNCKNEKVASTN